jgi:hypothetical protein
MVSLLGYFFCIVAVSTAAAGVMIGLVNISASERAGHYPHPRPVVERNDKELPVLPKRDRGAPAKDRGAPAKDMVATHTGKKGALKRGTNGGY